MSQAKPSCRYEHDTGSLFSDEQLSVWHDLAARGEALPFNSATMESLLDEIIRLRAALAEMTEQRDRWNDAAGDLTERLHDAGVALVERDVMLRNARGVASIVTDQIMGSLSEETRWVIRDLAYILDTDIDAVFAARSVQHADGVESLSDGIIRIRAALAERDAEREAMLAVGDTMAHLIAATDQSGALGKTAAHWRTLAARSGQHPDGTMGVKGDV